MGQDSKIEWTHHTMNPWRGCTKVSAGCTNCYAETISGRNPKTLGIWGPKGTRVMASESMWREPLKWDKAAAKAGERHRVFCASLADVFEDWTGPVSSSDERIVVRPYLESENVPENWQLEFPETIRTDPQGWRPITLNDVRERLFKLIEVTPNLNWLLLTKRPENFWDLLPSRWYGNPQFVHRMPRNVWLGVSVENQAAADERIPLLLQTPAVIRFLSVEPLLGPIEFDPNIHNLYGGIHWAIIGGESGSGARSCKVEWVRDIAKQCDCAGVKVFVKQLGAKPTLDRLPLYHEPGVMPPTSITLTNGPIELHLGDRKGGDITEFPADLRVRQFPEPAPCSPAKS